MFNKKHLNAGAFFCFKASVRIYAQNANTTIIMICNPAVTGVILPNNVGQ
jgi:hypothetical protein